MKPARSKDLVAAVAGLAALALGAFLFLRSQGALGARWSDGRGERAGLEGVRHAVWDRPDVLAALGPARDPTLSPDGLLLVFASGERGLNCQLFAAEIVDGEVRAPRVLSELDTPADELAPAFGADRLYFASDRAGGAGGLDLWSAPYRDGTFGLAEPLGPGLNSAADETEPAPQPGTGALFFATNRARADFDLYRAVPDANGFFVTEPLETLNTPAEERDPAFAREAERLFFASDRGGDLDLYRALYWNERWESPERLAALATPKVERAPALAHDGFLLYFTGEDEQGAPQLMRSRSLELVALPTPLVTLQEWLTLGALLLLAALAQLAKRWQALDILYKCLLVSLILHFLLLLFLRTVTSSAGSYELGREPSPTYRVELTPPTPSEDGRGLTRRARPGRATLPAEAVLPAPAPSTLAVPESAFEAPASERLARTADVTPEPALAEPPRETARNAAAAPSLTLGSHEPAPRASVAGPERAQPQSAREAAAPRSVQLDAPRLAEADLAEGLSREALQHGEAQVAAPPLAAPCEAFERRQGGTADLALAAPRVDVSARDASAHRAVLDLPPSGAAAPSGERQIARAEIAELDAGPARSALASPDRTAQGPATALRAPRAERAASSTSTPAFDAAAGLASSSAAPSANAAEGPTRSRDPGAAAELAQPGGFEARAAETAKLAAPGRARATPAGVVQTVPSLRAVEAEPAPRAGARGESANFDPLRGLAAPAGAPLAPAAAPARPTLAERTDEAPRAAPAAPPRLAPAPLEASSEPPRYTRTPYQNRFGEQKLRALEEFGGSAETERAVRDGLAYLAHIQGSNGAWGERSDAHAKYLDVRIGKSALALLAFLGAGHVPRGEATHAAVVERALDFLLGAQDEASGHFGRSCSYGHGIATYALAECYALTQDARLRRPLEHALEEVLRHQDQRADPRLFGGWGYYFADGHVWNDDDWPRTSVTAWQVMALESARLGGLEVPEPAFDAAREFLLGTWDREARAFRYDHDPARLTSGFPILPASTPAALFALSLLGVDARRDELAAARRFVIMRRPDGYRYSGDDDFVRRARGNLYFWYYGSLALFRVGGKEWELWNAALQETLLPAQDEDGSWRPLDTYAEYAGDEDAERTYTTAMCVLSLEVYYRYFTPLLKVK